MSKSESCETWHFCWNKFLRSQLLPFPSAHQRPRKTTGICGRSGYVPRSSSGTNIISHIIRSGWSLKKMTTNKTKQSTVYCITNSNNLKSAHHLSVSCWALGPLSIQSQHRLDADVQTFHLPEADDRADGRTNGRWKHDWIMAMVGRFSMVWLYMFKYVWVVRNQNWVSHQTLGIVLAMVDALAVMGALHILALGKSLVLQ